ncbi:MAG: TRAP transporter small permease [Pseudorhodoplanes sp.]|uniref:TRAP transporter small permease n=1 Tax=Pseudorhodoplanes sp. TaxID=1934341 RepID=UPI003D0B6429
MKIVRAILSQLDIAFAVIAGIALLYMMSLTVLDIIGRSLGLFTIGAGVEQTELMMVTLGFLGLARCLRVQGNIVVDVATSHLPAPVNARIDAFWLVVMALVLALLAWLVWNSGVSADRSGQRSELLGISPLVSHSIAVVGMIAAIMVALTTAARTFAGRGQPAGKDETIA